MALEHSSLRICAAAKDGVVIRPAPLRSDSENRRGAAIRIGWDSAQPESCEWDRADTEQDLDVDCLAGILVGFQDSYLIAVTESEKVASLPEPRTRVHAQVSRAKTVVAIPLKSHDRAQEALKKQIERQQSRRRRVASSVGRKLATKANEAGSATTTDDETDSSEADEADADTPPVPVAESTVSNRPFWKRALSKLDSTPIAQKKQVPTSSHEIAPEALAPTETAASGASVDPKEPSSSSDLPDVAATATEFHPASSSSDLPDVAATATEQAPQAADEAILASQRELDAKLVAECLRLMTGLYFSHTTDITRSLQKKHEKDDPLRHTPRWRLADRRYWYNENLMTPFVQAGLHGYIHILMQGFVDEVEVGLPLKPDYTLSSGLTSASSSTPSNVQLNLTIVSRGSTERPGLRYQRRGINASGQVANFVETEFIIECEREGVEHVGAFVQTRGSIPIYWSQSPWALKPPPVLERTPEESQRAMKQHLDGLKERYGRLVLVNLAEMSGKEATVTNAYRSGVESLHYDEQDLRYVSFDFHRETKGFNYGRISSLIDDIKVDLAEMRTFWATPDAVFSTQAGVCRINCVDSLDRTNVVQSAVARWVLNQHLIHLGITSAEEAGMHDDLDIAFNVLWADNGDAISREYAGTSALKGDFTRTGKRDWRGAMNDASNSIARILQSTVGDFFKQAAIDYILGVNLNAFEEFAERLETSDPGEIVRIAAIRQEAIDTATTEVLVEGETKVDAWNLLSPSDIDVVRPKKGGKYEEKVLLLSDKAIYVVTYEYSLQKVLSFLRIPTADIMQLQCGTYIVSSLDASGRDTVENYGFLLRFRASDVTERIRTYSLRTTSIKKRAAALRDLELPAQLSRNADVAASSESVPHYVAFKALRKDAVKVTSSDGSASHVPKRNDTTHQTAKETVTSVVDKIKAEAERIGTTDRDGAPFVVERDIISVAESKAATSIVDRLSHNLYKAIWL